MRFDGTLKSWNDDRGFGFIEPDQGGQDIFVHIKAFKSLRARPEAGQRLTFEVELGPQGKKRAFNVMPLQLPRKASSKNRREGPAAWGTASLFAIPVLLLVVLVGSLWGHPPRWVLWAYPLVSVVTFLAYAMDKSAARRGSWRTAENTLHLLALIGGWPGALVAQQLLRHKFAKAEFRAVLGHGGAERRRVRRAGKPSGQVHLIQQNHEWLIAQHQGRLGGIIDGNCSLKRDCRTHLFAQAPRSPKSAPTPHVPAIPTALRDLPHQFVVQGCRARPCPS